MANPIWRPGSVHLGCCVSGRQGMWSAVISSCGHDGCACKLLSILYYWILIFAHENSVIWFFQRISFCFLKLGYLKICFRRRSFRSPLVIIVFQNSEKGWPVSPLPDDELPLAPPDSDLVWTDLPIINSLEKIEFIYLGDGIWFRLVTIEFQIII